MCDAEFVAGLQRRYDILESEVEDMRRAVAEALAGQPVFYITPESADLRAVWEMIEPLLFEHKKGGDSQ